MQTTVLSHILLSVSCTFSEFSVFANENSFTKVNTIPRGEVLIKDSLNIDRTPLWLTMLALGVLRMNIIVFSNAKNVYASS